MKKVIVIIMTAANLACSCSPRVIEKIKTETVTEYRDRIVHDTTTFEIERIVEKIVTRDTVSRLENKYAKSDAVVSDGFLSHSLESKPQVIKVPYQVHVTDTVYKEKASETVTETKYVEKRLNIWQRFRLWAFPFILILLAWAYRKQIASLVKCLIKVL